MSSKIIIKLLESNPGYMTGCISEITTGGAGLLVPSGYLELEDLAKAIAQLINSRDLRLNLLKKDVSESLMNLICGRIPSSFWK